MKKFLSVLLALCLLVGAVPMIASATGEYGLWDIGDVTDDLSWTLMTNGVLTIGRKDFESTVTDNIPNYNDTNPPWAKYKADIQTVIIGNGVGGVGSNAFKDCKNLKTLYIPAGIAGCGMNAFTGCSNLKTIHCAASESDPDTIEFLNKMSYGSTIPNNIERHFNCDKSDFVDPKPIPRSPFSDVSLDDYFAEGAIWAYQHSITLGVGGDKFGPEDPCKRDQIVTFLYRYMGSPDIAITNQFNDMPANEEFQKAISWAVRKKITLGVGNGKFGPGKGCTRAEAVTFLWRAAGNPKPDAMASFADMPANTDFQQAISWAAENGITKGNGNNLFDSDTICTRGQIVTFLYRWSKLA